MPSLPTLDPNVLDPSAFDPSTFDPGALAALVLSSAALMGSPGPSVLSAMAVGAAFGLRRAAPYAAGLVLGTWAVLAAVASGILAALLAAPVLAPVLSGAAALYMLYLAWRIVTAPPPRSSAATAAPPLLAGLALAVANPKAWLAIGAVFSGARLSAAPFADAALKLTVLAAMVVLIHLAWLAAGGALATHLQSPRIWHAARLAFAATLAAATLAGLLG